MLSLSRRSVQFQGATAGMVPLRFCIAIFVSNGDMRDTSTCLFCLSTCVALSGKTSRVLRWSPDTGCWILKCDRRGETPVLSHHPSFLGRRMIFFFLPPPASRSSAFERRRDRRGEGSEQVGWVPPVQTSPGARCTLQWRQCCSYWSLGQPPLVPIDQSGRSLPPAVGAVAFCGARPDVPHADFRAVGVCLLQVVPASAGGSFLPSTGRRSWEKSWFATSGCRTWYQGFCPPRARFSIMPIETRETLDSRSRSLCISLPPPTPCRSPATTSPASQLASPLDLRHRKCRTLLISIPSGPSS